MIDPEILSIVDPIGFDPVLLRSKYDAERDKRLRDDGNEQYVEVSAEFSHFVDDPYVEPGFSRPPIYDEVDAVVVGAGLGGLLAGARLREAGIGRIRLVDRAGDVGGTWYWNRYPGCMCDVVSLLYLPLLEELKYTPKRLYAYADEIFEHCQRIATHYGLYDESLFQTAITNMVWDPEINRWVVETDRGDRFTSQFVILASGSISRPKLPAIPGVNEFKGHTFHTSRWDYGYTGGDLFGGLTALKDKTVGIVGTGATAIQCVPHLGQWAKQLYVFQRTPSSVDVRNNREIDKSYVVGWEQGWQRRRQENFDTLLEGGYQEEDLTGDAFTDLARRFTGTVREASRVLGRRLTPEEKDLLQQLADYQKMEEIRARISSIVKDPETAEKLKPWYRQGCKRPCFSDEYLPTFNRPNVTLVDTDGKGIDRLTENSVVVKGQEYPVDCLIFASGFEVGTNYSRRSQLEIVGENGQRLSDKWAHGPRTLWGMQTHGFPNCFFIDFIQNAFVVCVTHSLDEQASHIAFIIRNILEQGASVVDVNVTAEDEWLEQMQQLSGKRLEFFRQCTPGYYNNEGKVDESPWSSQRRVYGGGSRRYFNILGDWRENANLAGEELRPTPS